MLIYAFNSQLIRINSFSQNVNVQAKTKLNTALSSRPHGFHPFLSCCNSAAMQYKFRFDLYKENSYPLCKLKKCRLKKQNQNVSRRVLPFCYLLSFYFDSWKSFLIALILAFCASTSLVTSVNASSGHHLMHCGSPCSLQRSHT